MKLWREHSTGCSMAYDGRKNGLRRQEAVSMDKLVDQFIRDMKLASGLKRQRAEDAWRVVSGAGRYTLDVNLYNGIMTCTLSSSVVRNQLFHQRTLLVQSLNEYLKNDELFMGDSRQEIIRTLILR